MCWPGAISKFTELNQPVKHGDPFAVQVGLPPGRGAVEPVQANVIKNSLINSNCSPGFFHEFRKWRCFMLKSGHQKLFIERLDWFITWPFG
jgi:hypothetical protein